MFSGLTITLLAVGYLGLLFAIAYLGDQSRVGKEWAGNPFIYSLSLAVYCSSWTFYGAVGRASTSGWEFLATYIGPAIVFIFAWQVLEKINRVSKQQNITTISDFISSRYGKSQTVAVLVTTIAVLGTIPYIALQLKAVAVSYNAIAPGATETLSAGSDTALVVALMMAVFAILFGTRHIDATEHHEGLVLAVAFESIIKLAAFLAVGLFVTFEMFGGLESTVAAVRNELDAAANFNRPLTEGSFITEIILACGAAICLPRQFHVTIVENTRTGNLRMARWLFPLYLMALALFVLPIATAGNTYLPYHPLGADSYVLSLPLAAGHEYLASFVFIGGLSAATSMVIVAVITLATMVCNDIVIPILLRIPSLRLAETRDLGSLLLSVRRITIFCLLLMGYFYYRILGDQGSLASFGLLAFVAAVQFLPAILGAVYWTQGNRYGAIAGLSAGFALWVYTLVIPALSGAKLIPDAFDPVILAPEWLAPTTLFGLTTLDPLTHGVIWSLGLNSLFYILGSKLLSARLVDRIQASAYVDSQRDPNSEPGRQTTPVTVSDLQLLAERFLGIRRTQQAFNDFAIQRNEDPSPPSERAHPDLIQFTERLLAGVIGASSARIVMDSTLRGKSMQLGDVVAIVDEASQALRFNRSLLQSTIENVTLGISVVDQKLRLVAWNQRFIEMFDFPEELITVGRPIEEIFRYNAIHGEYGDSAKSIDELVEERMEMLRSRTQHDFERYRPDGKVLEVRGNPMPDGGYVSTYMDITEHKRTEEALRESEENVRIYTDSVPVMITYLDPEQNFLFVNKTFADAMELDRHTIAGTPSHSVFSETEYLLRQPYVERVLQGQRVSFEAPLPTLDDSHRVAELTMIPHIGDYGDVLGYFTLYQDITERRIAELAIKETNENLEKRVTERTQALQLVNKELRKENTIRALMEDELRQAKSDAEDANLGKTRFLAAASHDLLQPLNAARLFTSALTQKSHEEETRQLVENVDGALRSAEELITALLDISKLDAGALEPKLSHFSLEAVFSNLTNEFRAMADKKNLEFKSVACKQVVYSDQTLLRRVLQNFISNAIRYTTQGKVLLGARRVGNKLRLEVWDTGVGIAPDKIGEVFEEFKRIDNPRHSEVQGLGLGLAITERIARMLAHDLNVRSWPMEGTVFSVDVPLGDPNKAERAAPESRGWIKSKGLNGIKVLVIDNEPKILEGMSALLKGWSCEVRTALSAVEAETIIRAESFTPDIILADYHLSENDTGLMALEQIEPLLENPVPAIVITADRTDEIKQEIANAGAKLLNKPVKPAALRQMITKSLK
jgi:PAS domain S-box-containing protein